MNDTRFIIIITSYNKEKWIGFNVNSIKQQSYGNFVAIYGYDKSSDNTRQVIEANIQGDSRFILYDNPVQESQLSNYFSCIHYLKANGILQDEDVIVELDADDWLLHPFVLQHLNDIYQNNDIWMTYGQYITYPNGEFGSHFYMHLDDEIDKHNAYRQAPFPYSHLKTYKMHLLDKVPAESLIDPETNRYFNITADFALCMPMVEMAGKARIYRVENPIYVYNVSEDADNESARRLEEQKHKESVIRQLKPCSRL